jgi:hypothetical protein
MKQKDRRELRSTISKKSAILENPEYSAEYIAIENMIETPHKKNGYVEELEMTVKGRGRGRPKKIIS